MRKAVLSTFILVFLLVCANCEAGLGELRKIAAAQADAQREYKEETKAFERVKNAIDSGYIKKGQTKKEIKDRYGEPVVNTRETETRRDKWIYKPASSSFFSGVKIYLYFDRDDKLDEIKVVE
ncbi:MAG: hypothetical protein PHI58_03405 [Candidatus Omnitrophica bacterium]|nr:hypothetical protein [Candidatus Omnitrophota bacterium]